MRIWEQYEVVPCGICDELVESRGDYYYEGRAHQSCISDLSEEQNQDRLDWEKQDQERRAARREASRAIKEVR
jgi:hypothetical protein